MERAEFKYFVERVKKQTDIVKVIRRHIKLDRNLKGSCLFHADENPSFSVNAQKQYFYCFGCGKGGDVFKFLQLFEDKPFLDVLIELAKQANIKIPDFLKGDRKNGK